MKKILPVAALLILLSASCGKKAPAVSPPPAGIVTHYTQPMQVGNKQILVEIADTDQSRAQGLSGRMPLTDAQGMLFTFGTSTDPGFWMKDMRFGLDFIWIADGKIVGITPNIPAPASATSTLPIYYPPSPVDSVLEVDGGWAARNNVTIGNGAHLLDTN